MAKVSQAQEPSMEEILASIRRIISDDDADSLPPPAPPKPAPISTEAIDALFGARAPEPAAPVAPPPPAAARVEQRTVRAAEPAPSRPAPQPVRPASVAPSPAPRPAYVPSRTEPRPAAVAAAEAPAAGHPLLSPGADAAVNAAFGNLAGTLLSGPSRTLEDLVKDMLRPMLKSWLDTNLPPLVERLVRDEIERVSRGR